jgi:hypothetical protein
MSKPAKFNGDSSDAPSIQAYYHLWGKHEFDMDNQRNILLWFLNDKGLDKEFMEYLNYWFPEDEDGVRQSRADLEEKMKTLQEKLRKQ